MKFAKFIFLLVLFIPVLWPIFRSDFFQMHDWTHVARLVELDLAIKAGQIPPRWAPDFGWGYGMPLFHFYAPLPYYFAELFYLIKVPAVWAIKAVFAFNFIAGGYFMYLWAKEQWGKLGGLISAIAFVYLPYRAVQFYVRGALGELTAMTFIPLFFYAVQKKKIVLAALAWTGIFLSHNVIALFSLIFMAGYFLFHIKYWRQWLILSLLTFGLSAFFLLPAFLEKDLTIVNNLTGGYSNYKFHFIYLRQLWQRTWGYGGSIFGLEDNISFQLGWPQIFLFFPALWFWRKSIYVFIALSLAIFMMTFHSQFIWDRVPILALAQFPWRLLAFAATFVAFFSGSIFSFREWGIFHSRNVLSAVIIFLIIILNWQYFRPEKFSPVNDYYYTDRQKIASKMSDILFDYLPKTAVKPIIPRDINGPFNQFYFPGWQVKNSNGQWLDASLNVDSGLILTNGGEIRLTKTKLQQISDMITLITWGGLAVYLIKFYGFKRS